MLVHLSVCLSGKEGALGREPRTNKHSLLQTRRRPIRRRWLWLGSPVRARLVILRNTHSAAKVRGQREGPPGLLYRCSRPLSLPASFCFFFFYYPRLPFPSPVLTLCITRLHFPLRPPAFPPIPSPHPRLSLVRHSLDCRLALPQLLPHSENPGA